MKLNRTSLVCSPSISFFFSLCSPRVCVYLFIHAPVRGYLRVYWSTCNSLFSRSFSRRVARRGTVSLFISPLPVFAFRNSPSLHHVSLFSLIIISTVPACVCVSIFLLILFTATRESIRRFSIENIYEHITYIIQNISYSVHDIFRRSFYKYSDTFVSRCLYS